ncbi:MAG: pyridoxamine 5'-phosphate oxidase family protein [Pseudoflavonifractor sp.]|nr:pyridoxamine 5'-phosphate oxidase family protein [Pseudoflavonifractor sp.]
MFREMRRIRQKLSPEETEAILQRGTSGVLALSGDDGYPYAVPTSYVYTQGKIYFHCAVSGHKIDAIRRSGKASFCVIDQDQVVPEKFTTYFRSAIAFGQIRILEDTQEKRAAIETLAMKYTPDDAVGREREIDGFFRILCMLELAIEHLSGKESIELINAKKSQ